MCENRECLESALNIWADMYNKKDKECFDLLLKVGQQAQEITKLEVSKENLAKEVSNVLEYIIKEVESVGTGRGYLDILREVVERLEGVKKSCM